MLIGLAGLMFAGSTSGLLIPSPTSPQAGLAHSVAVNNTGYNVYAMTISFSEPVRVGLTQGFCATSCTYTLNSTWQNVSRPTAFLATLSSATTWINGTGACGLAACPAGTAECDLIGYGISPAAANSVGAPCFRLELTWPSGTFQGVAGLRSLNYTVTRVDVYVAASRTLWSSAGMTDTESATITAPSSTFWSPTVYNWSVRSASWVLPLSKGTWNYQSFSLTILPNRTSVPSTNYTLYSQYALVQWQYGFPATVGTNTSLTAVLSITAVSGPAGITAWQLTNQSYPAIQITPAGTVALIFGNESTLPNGRVQFTVTWNNPYGVNYTGAFVLGTAGLASSSQVNLTANGVALSPAQYTVAGATIRIGSGIVPVANATAVTFIVSYLPVSNWGFFVPSFYLNGFGVEPAHLTVAGTGVLTVGAYFFQPQTRARRAIAVDVAGIAGSIGLVIMWLIL